MQMIDKFILMDAQNFVKQWAKRKLQKIYIASS